MNYVNYDDFSSMDMRMGLIKFVEPVEGTDKLLRFEIDFGQIENPEKSSMEIENEETVFDNSENENALPFGKEEYKGRDVRQIVSGLKEFFPEYEELVGTYGLYILNLKPREIKGVMSNGMLMALDGKDGNPVFLQARGDIEPGAKIR